MARSASHRLTNLQSYEAVKNALGGDPLPGDNDANGDPLALRLPEDIALFRRYVERGTKQAGTGFAWVQRVGTFHTEGEQKSG